MSRSDPIPKLPGISHQQAVRALERAGFRVLRQRKHVVNLYGSQTTAVRDLA